MRQSRLKASPELPVAYYHCVSRVVDRQFVFGEIEREQFVRFMRLYETFCGLRVVTYCVMSNHFHLLLEVPQRPTGFSLSDEALLERLKPVNSALERNTLRRKLAMLHEAGADGEAEAVKAAVLARMYDLSAFMKLLKGRFTQWFNRTHARRGTLWEERFKSVLVEAAGEALTTMAAYIDLNPVRAGMVSDPKDYRWSGYGEAVAGGMAALAGLQLVTDTREARFGGEAARQKAMEEASGLGGKETILARYRVLVYQQGQEGAEDAEGQPVRRGFTEEEITEVMARKGKLNRWEMLHCRVRYFSDGAVIGSKAFVQEVFRAERGRFGPKRKAVSHPLRGLDAGGLRSLRDLRVKPIG